MAVSDSDNEVSSKTKARNGKKIAHSSDAESEEQKGSGAGSEADEDDEEYEIEDILEAKRSSLSPVRPFPCLTRSSERKCTLLVDMPSQQYLSRARIHTM